MRTFEKPSLVFFHWKDCGHCQKTYPQWNAFLKTASQKFPNVFFYQTEASSEPELHRQYKVSGYPTFIVITASGASVPFPGARSAPEIETLLASTLSKGS